MNGQQYLSCSKAFQSIFVNYTREWMIEWMSEKSLNHNAHYYEL